MHAYFGRSEQVKRQNGEGVGWDVLGAVELRLLLPGFRCGSLSLGRSVGSVPSQMLAAKAQGYLSEGSSRKPQSELLHLPVRGLKRQLPLGSFPESR